MTVPRFQLGVDFGTSNTVAVLDGRPLLFDGAPVLPSAVCADRSGGLLIGRDAAHAAGTTPEGFEPHPKRRIDDGTVLLGRAEVPVTHLIAAVLRRVADEAHAVTGGGTPTVTLTYPVAWAAPRQQVLRDAARQAGLGAVRLVPEPVAAAAYFAANAGVDLPVGACAVVYDIGAGTFDVSVVEISRGEVRGGAVFLMVRVAVKVPLGESFETQPGTGPFVEVAAAADGRAIRLRSDPRGPQSDMEELVEDLKDRRGDDVVEGFTVRFSAFGFVQQVEWLFNPGG